MHFIKIPAPGLEPGTGGCLRGKLPTTVRCSTSELSRAIKIINF